MQLYVSNWQNIRCACFHTIVPIFAVGTDNKVSLCNEEGDPVEEVQCRKNPAQLCWNPHSTMLAIGCDDGMLYIYHHKKIWSDDSVHSAAFTFVKWNPEGNRLVCGDVVCHGLFHRGRDGEGNLFAAPSRQPCYLAGQSGLVSVWRMDTPGRLVPAYQQRQTQPFTTCCFRTSGARPTYSHSNGVAGVRWGSVSLLPQRPAAPASSTAKRSVIHSPSLLLGVKGREEGGRGGQVRDP